MVEAAYVQKEDGEFVNETAFSVWNGLRLMGTEVRLFEESEFDSLELRKSILVHGWIRVVRKAFDKLGVKQPVLNGWPPEELMPFYGRKFWTLTMGDVRKLREHERVFIKPLDHHKAFHGHVTSGRFKDLIATASFEDDFKVLASDPIDFVSEYRVFVHNGTMIGCRHYHGDFTKHIDFGVARACLAAYRKAPVAYSLDLGATVDGRTLVVEVNDAFALGSYGMASIPYVRMIVDRWEEIVGS